MTPKLIGQYVELANKYLDHIPVENTSDFEVIAEALKSITDSHQSHIIPETLKGRITDISDLLENPDLYVEKQAHYQEFKNIILSRVAAKIHEFAQLTPKEKATYIANQSQIKQESKQNHDNMAQHQAPAINSEAHTISEQEMLAEQQRRFQAEPYVQNRPHWVQMSSSPLPSLRRPRRFFGTQQPSNMINGHVDIEEQRRRQIYPPLDIVGPNGRQRIASELGMSYYQTTSEQETTAEGIFRQLIRNADRERESDRAQGNTQQERESRLKRTVARDTKKPRSGCREVSKEYIVLKIITNALVRL